ncbi:CHAT domain-containing protein [Gloeothece verrucosa]|uniref:TPR repeat-containing protein n=1 Tax=Gloeothece verrucosa (strain PCC 7822) TaxID=497965 RepID=E0UG33_GLOV7|nr:CHAT domain-containing protein [Gloeothece verrucosa]ADN15534.1 TPR repeat-containing protein [Gloeothece verrucosa PCC 7822]
MRLLLIKNTAQFLMMRAKRCFAYIINFKKSQYLWVAVLTLFLVTGIHSAVGQPPVIPIAQHLLEEGRQFYRDGQFNQAIEIWKQAAETYQQQGDPLRQALSLNYLSLAYQATGQWNNAQTAINQSLELLKNRSTQETISIRAPVLNTLGSLQLAQGETENALATWQEAESLYTQLGDQEGRIGTQINQAQALQQLGLYRRSQQILTRVAQTLQSQPDSSLKASGLQSLGVALSSIGDLKNAQEILQESLAISQKLADKNSQSTTLLSLGNIMRLEDKHSQALKYYQQAADMAPDTLLQLEAQINQLSLLIKLQQWENATIVLSQIESRVPTLTPSRRSIYAIVNFASNLMEASPLLTDTRSRQLASLLASSVQAAKTLFDLRSQAYALGTLGRLYELKQQWREAQDLTEQARQLALAINADDIIYQWQWQLARLLEAQGNYPQAIAANTAAVDTLQSLRKDLVAINPDVQFSFRESVEPVYRDLIRLLLTPLTPSTPISQPHLQQARQVLESLQLAELENFFREACITAQPKQIDQIDQTAAVIYAIILKDRLAVILSLPGQPLSYYETRISQEEIENTLDLLFQSFNPAYSNQIRLQLSQQVYNWLIHPAQEKLTAAKVETLVFVLDGFLRNLPMSALYDGQNYLIEKYKIALTPGLQLLDPQALSTKNIKAILAGVSEKNEGFSALPAVETELADISREIIATKLLNQDFTRSRFTKQLEQTPFPIIHLATHGQFSSDPEETFILAWQDPIKVKDLQNLLRIRQQQNPIPIELLVLSACQTASGDKRATLGLAGMAVRSGARSTVATLWSVRDESTAQLMTEFYRSLSEQNRQTSKAAALRLAQLNLINSPQFEHPFYWAPFVLVGNWL